jgi:hypothetical protein
MLVSVQDCRKSLQLLLVVILCTLSGCTAPVVQPDAAVSINNVGILAFLPSELRYEKIGFTVFSNERLLRPVGDTLNASARSAAESGVKRKVGRKVIQLNEGLPDLRTKLYSRTLVMRSSMERIQSELAQIAKMHNLDAIVVIAEVTDSDQGRTGVRVYHRGPGFRPQIQPDLVIFVVNREGITIARHPSPLFGVPATRPGNKPWDSDFAKSIDAETHAHVLLATERLVADTVSSRIMELGL